MPRIAGTDIPANKKAWVSLTYIYGIGPHVSREILEKAGINPETRSKDLTEDQIQTLAKLLEEGYEVEGQLRRVIAQNIQRLKKIQCYRGIRHIRGLPVRGQRTRTNSRTRKGKRKTVANKKKAGKK
jgi:small subunit ribosomal protein S13